MANGAASSHPHLALAREEPVTERRSPRAFSSAAPPDDPRRHATVLRERLQAARAAAATEDVGGYDERHLIKITLAAKVSPEDVAKATGNVHVVSQEDDTLLLAFGSDEQLTAFETKLDSLVVRHVIIFGHGHGLQRAIIDESQHRTPERLIMAQH